MGRIATSIPQLDNLLNGGIEHGSLSCLWVKPGLDGAPFAYQIANAALKDNKVFYIINSKNPDSVKADIKSFGFNPEKFNFVDSYSNLVGAKSKYDLVVSNPKDPDEILNEISIIIKKIKNPLIILDTLSTLIDMAEKEDVTFLNKLKNLKATTVCLFTEWPYKPDFIKNLKTIFDNIIEVKAVEEKVFFREYFGVTKVKTGETKSQAIPYKIIRPEGIKIYIPKILITGPFNSGKTSFIHSSSIRAVSVDRLGTTIALDHGHVRYKDFAVDLFGTPGQQRFDPILKLLGGEAFGVIVIISAVDPQSFPRAFEMMKKAQVYGLPVIFIANKANLKGALTPQQIKTRMDLEKEDVVIPVTAKDLTKVQPGLPCQLKDDDIEKVLDALFDKILKGGIKSG